MTKYPIPAPFSGGILLSYKCTTSCKHCMYACSPRWPADWISEEDAARVLSQLAAKMRDRYPFPGRVGVNEGIHFTGGEPFLNFDLLLRLVETAERLGIPSTFVETNGFWCREAETTREKLRALKDAGLDGILLSANPFILEGIPFERTARAVSVGREVFGANAIVYQRFFYDQFTGLGLRGTLAFDEYLERAGYGLQYVELFANGRVPYKLAHLYQHHPARRFFGASCRRELIRDWHIHVDNYCNFVPGYCGGLSLGDARELDAICGGIDLDALPVLKALLTDLADLYHLGRERGYVEREGYISKCHLCIDVRRHLARHGDFAELKPGAFYDRLED
jgi:hypothetical protein